MVDSVNIVAGPLAATAVGTIAHAAATVIADAIATEAAATDATSPPITMPSYESKFWSRRFSIVLLPTSQGHMSRSQACQQLVRISFVPIP